MQKFANWLRRFAVRGVFWRQYLDWAIANVPVYFLPVLIWIWATKSFVVALLITVCILPVSLADNVLKPIVMGRGLTTPALVIFIGVIGGTLAHGIVGLFIGPIILAVAWELLTAWVRDEELVTVPVETEAAKDNQLEA